MKIDKETKRQLRRKRLMDNKVYQVMGVLTRYMDRYYLDAIIGLIPGWGDVIALVSVIPFVYFSLFIIRSVPLTLAVLANALRDVFLGMLPFYVGDVIDFFHRSHVQNMEMMRKCARRFNNIYGIEFFPEPQNFYFNATALKVPGLDGSGKMGYEILACVKQNGIVVACYFGNAAFACGDDGKFHGHSLETSKAEGFFPL